MRPAELPLSTRVDNTHAVTRGVALVYAVAWAGGIVAEPLRHLDLPLHVVVGGAILGALVVNGFVRWERVLSPRGQELAIAVAVALAWLQLVIVVTASPEQATPALMALPVVTTVSAFMLRPWWHAAASVAGIALLAALAARPDVDSSLLLWTLLTGASMAWVAGYVATRMALGALERDRARTSAERATAALETVVRTIIATTSDDEATVVRRTVDVGSSLGLASTSVLVTTGAAVHADATEPTSGDGAAGTTVLVHGGDGIRLDEARLRALLASCRERGHAVHDGRSIAWPVHVDGAVTGVLAATGVDEPPDDVVRHALQLLAAHLSQALSLSRAIDADRMTLARLRDVDEQRNDFVATVSHELRTPLTVIDGLLETIQVHRERLSAGEQAMMLDRVRTNAAQLRGIVTSLLDSARLDAGLVPETARVDLVAVVTDAVTQLAPVLESHDVTVTSPTSAPVTGDAELLRRVVDNLLTNAAHHTPPGTHVAVTITSVGDEVGVEVTDDGPGIPARLVPTITGRFVRGGDHRTRSTRGLGIGLSLVEQVLRLHSSRLDVGTAPGGGASFRFRLPRAVHDDGDVSVQERAS